MKIDIDIRKVVPPAPAPEPIRQITVPEDGGRYMVLRDDWETEEWGFKPRSHALNYKSDPPWNALPATVPLDGLFCKLSEAWQRFYFSLIRRANGYSVPMDVMLQGYRRTTRDSGGWRDRHTWNNVKDVLDPDDPTWLPKIFTDYVLGLNVPPDFTRGDAAQKDLLSSGNIVKIIGQTASHYMIETLDPFLPPPSVDEVWGKWWLVGWATLSAYNFDTNTRARLKWPFFDGYGCPLMSLSRDGINRVERFWCKPVENGAVINLYTV